ncbi:MAG: RNA-binding protein [Candidatus Zixiibacteriota bacterium]
MNIYVGGLLPEVTSKQLREEFKRFGTVKSAEVAKSHKDGAPRGFGFVEMPIERQAVAAIAALRGTTRMGSALEVNEVRRPAPNPHSRPLVSQAFLLRKSKKAS